MAVGKRTQHTFPVGALVLVDGERYARVGQSFPEGSSSYMFPHYKVHFVGGDQNVAVNVNRVGVTPRKGVKLPPPPPASDETSRVVYSYVDRLVLSTTGAKKR